MASQMRKNGMKSYQTMVVPVRKRRFRRLSQPQPCPLRRPQKQPHQFLTGATSSSFRSLVRSERSDLGPKWQPLPQPPPLP